MEVFPNYYSLIFVTGLPQESIDDFLSQADNQNILSISDCLRAEKNYAGQISDTGLMISSPNMHDLFYEPLSAFGERITQLFGDYTIFACYYDSVTGTRGIYHSVKGRIEVSLYDVPSFDNYLDDLEGELIEATFGQSLNTLLGKDVSMFPFD